MRHPSFYRALSFFCGLGLLLSTSGSEGSDVRVSQPIDIRSDYHQRVYLKDDGLPSNWINDILQSSSGYLWIATKEGLARFDGNEFVVFNRSNTPAFHDDRCMSLAETEDALWVGTRNGAVHFKDGRFTRFYHPRVTPPNQSVVLLPRAEGGIWVYGAFLAAFDGGDWEIQETPISGDDVGVFRADGGALWVGTSHDLFQWDGSEWTETFTDRAGPHSVRALWLEENRPSWILAGPPGSPGGFWLFGRSEGGWDQEHSLSGQMQPLFFEQSSDGAFWFPNGTEMLGRLADGELDIFSVPMKHHEDGFQCFVEDREGNLWLGTEHSGLHQLVPLRLETFSGSNWLKDDHVATLARDERGALWVGTLRGVARWNTLPNGPRDRVLVEHFFSAEDPLATNRVKSIACGPDGSTWIASHGGGLHRIQEGEVETVRIPGDHNDNKLTTVLLDDEFVWAGSVRRLHLLAGERLFSLMQPDLSRPYLIHCPFQKCASEFTVRAMVQSGDDLWVGTDPLGLVRIELQDLRAWLRQPGAHDGTEQLRIEQFRQTDGLSMDSLLAIHRDEEDPADLWIGAESGLNWCRRGKIFSLTGGKGLPLGSIRQILEDDRSNLWIGCEEGILRVAKEDLKAAALGAPGKVEFVLFEERDGMLARDVTGEVGHPSGVRTSDGRLWFGTEQGVVAIRPDALRENEVPPPVLIEEVRANNWIVYGNRPSPNPAERTALMPVDGEEEIKKLRFSPGASEFLELHYTAVSFTAPQDLKFLYKLDGYDKTWRDAGNRRVAFYTGLPPGEYRFQVKARNEDLVWSRKAAVIDFTVAPHLYQRLSVWLLLSLMLVAAAWVFHRSRLAQARQFLALQAENRRLTELAEVSTTMHSLTSANLAVMGRSLEELERSGAAEGTAPEAVKHHVARIIATSQEMVRSLREMVWVTSPANQTLEAALEQLGDFSQSFLHSSGLTARLSLPSAPVRGRITFQQRKALYLIWREALANAVVHSGSTRVSISVQVTADGDVQVVIEDNGKGTAAVSENGSGTGTGTGLRHMQELAQGQGWKLHIRSSSEGTQVHLEIPVRTIVLDGLVRNGDD